MLIPYFAWGDAWANCNAHTYNKLHAFALKILPLLPHFDTHKIILIQNNIFVSLFSHVVALLFLPPSR